MRAKTSELRSLKEEDLDKRLAELKTELIKLYTQVSTGTTLKNPSDVRDTRKGIAKILTLKREREIEGMYKTVNKEAAKKVEKKEVKEEKQTKSEEKKA